MLHVYEGFEIAVRDIDSFWDATAMGKRFGKKPIKFLSTKETQAYIASLARNLGVPESELIEVSKGGREPRTWMHRRLALKFAAWLNPDFEVWVYQVIEKLLTQGEVKLKDEISSLQQALGVAEQQIEMLNNETGLLEYKIDRLRYANDELAEIAQWRSRNSWGGSDI